jgi:hypothetical protein
MSEIIRSVSATQRVAESGGIMTSKNLVKPKRLGKTEFVEEYVRNSILFGFGEPTKEDIDRTYILVKNSGKKKRVKRKTESVMSKEEHFAMNIRNSTLLFGEPPTEEELNKEWDMYKFQLQYRAIRGTKKQKEVKRAAFMAVMEQEMMSRYSPEAIEERRLRKEVTM